MQIIVLFFQHPGINLFLQWAFIDYNFSISLAY